MKDKKTLEIKVERTISASPREVFKAWMDPEVPGTPWNIGEKLILQAKVDGLFYWLVNGTPHYGRFTKFARPGIIQHTWMSPYTDGRESMVTVTFGKKGDETLMTLVHSGLPNNGNGKEHVGGWNEFLDAFPEFFKKASRKRK
ncbi:MAG: SRPBCC domain-containing protein [Fibrobacteria bacterium]